MRFAAIADIHGNRMALDAVLADIELHGVAPDCIVNLGDCLSGPLEAGRTADRLLALDLPTVRGNHDRYLIEHDEVGMHSWEADAYGQLDPRHLDWLRNLPVSMVWRDTAFLCHATPGDDQTYWTQRVTHEGIVCPAERADIEALAEGIKQPIILCGHTHLPRAVRLSDGRLVVNPGSVGCPAYDDDVPVYHRVEAGTPLASYAILEQQAAGWSVTFRLVPYDHMSQSRLAGEKGRPTWQAGLATGWLPR